MVKAMSLERMASSSMPRRSARKVSAASGRAMTPSPLTGSQQ